MNPKSYIVGPNGYAFYLYEIEVFPLPRRFLFACPVDEGGRLDVSRECLAALVKDPFLRRKAIQDLLRAMPATGA